MLEPLHFPHLIGGKVIVEDEGTGVELQVDKCQERRIREGGKEEHLKGLMNSTERSTEFRDHEFVGTLNHVAEHCLEHRVRLWLSRLSGFI